MHALLLSARMVPLLRITAQTRSRSGARESTRRLRRKSQYVSPTTGLSSRTGNGLGISRVGGIASCSTRLITSGIAIPWRTLPLGLWIVPSPCSTAPPRCSAGHSTEREDTMQQFVTVFDFMQLLVRCWDQPSDGRVVLLSKLQNRHPKTPLQTPVTAASKLQTNPKG